MTDLWPAPRALAPVHASVRLPGSKSLTNRELVLAALADGPSVIGRALRSRDTELMAAALTALSNGRWGTRGGREDADGASLPLVVANGVYSGVGPGTSLAPGPAWAWLDVADPSLPARLLLDLRQAVAAGQAEERLGAEQVAQEVVRREHRPHALERGPDVVVVAQALGHHVGVELGPAALGQLLPQPLLDEATAGVVGAGPAAGLAHDPVAGLGRAAEVEDAEADDEVVAEGPLAIAHALGDDLDHAGLAQSTFSTHLAVLAKAGLVRSEKRGRNLIQHADIDTLRGLMLFLAKDCCQGRAELCEPLLAELACC